MACGAKGGGGGLDGVWAAPAAAAVGAGAAGGVVVGGLARAGSARGWWQRCEAGEGGGPLVGPGPCAGEAEGRAAGGEWLGRGPCGGGADRRAAGVEAEPGAGVRQPVAQRLGFAAGEL